MSGVGKKSDPFLWNIESFKKVSSVERRKIIKQAVRYCPELTDINIETVFVGKSEYSWYDEHELVCLTLHSGKRVFGYYTPGDFRPVDPQGKNVQALNRLAPLRLGNPETVTAYSLTRIQFELPKIYEESGNEWHLACIITSPDELQSYQAALADGEEKMYELIVPDPKAVHDNGTEAESPGYRLRASLLLTGGPVDTLVQIQVEIAEDGQISYPKRHQFASCELHRKHKSENWEVAELWCPILIRPAMLQVDWQLLPENAAARLKEQIEVTVGQDRYSLLRIAELEFYRNLYLLEVIIFLGGTDEYRRSYALVTNPQDKDKKLNIFSLDGSSGVIHQINKVVNEIRLTEETVDKYLRFFCWAVHGEEGPFYLPNYFWEIPLDGNADQWPRKKFNLGIFRVKEEEAQKTGYDDKGVGFRRKAITVYSNALFRAWFLVRDTGMIEMVYDEEIAGDLELDTERYNTGDLISLDLQGHGTEELGEPINRGEDTASLTMTHYLEERFRSGRGDNKSDAAGALHAGELVSAEQFWNVLEERGNICSNDMKDSIVVQDRITFGGSKPGRELLPGKDEVYICDCVFKQPVYLNNIKEGPAFVFINCLFESGLEADEAVVPQSLKFLKCDFKSIDGDNNDLALNFENARFGGEILLYRCRIGGRLFAPGIRSEGNMCLRGCRLAFSTDSIGQNPGVDEIGKENLRDLLKSRGWKFNGRFDIPLISLEGAELGGDLEIIAGSSELKPSSSGDEALKEVFRGENRLLASVVDGNVASGGITVKGNIRLYGTYCRGVVDFSSSHCSHNIVFHNRQASFDTQFRSGGYVSLLNLHLSGYLNLDYIQTKQLQLYSIHIGSYLTLVGANIRGELTLYGADIAGNVNLAGLTVHDSLDLNFSRIQGFITAFRNTKDKQDIFTGKESILKIEGDLLLSGARVNVLEIRGADIGGSLIIKTGKFGRLFLTLGITSPDGKGDSWIPVPCKMARVNIASIEVEERLDFSGLQVTGKGSEASTDFAKIAGKGQDGVDNKTEEFQEPFAGLILRHSVIKSNLSFFTNDPATDLRSRYGMDFSGVSPADFGANIDYYEKQKGDHRDIGSLDLKANEIGGHLNLGNLKVRKKSEDDTVWGYGPIFLNDTHVRLDVEMGSGEQNRYETVCGYLDIEKLACDGDLKLTGLRVSGDFDSRGAKIKGEFYLCPEQSSGIPFEGSSDTTLTEPVPGYAWIKQSLHLTAAEASEIWLSRRNFGPLSQDFWKTKKKLSPRLDLSRSRFGKVNIDEPPPAPVKLSKISVDVWNFGNPTENNTADDFIRMLQGMTKFDRSTWIGVENFLRNQARESEANKVYRAMRRQARKERAFFLSDVPIGWVAGSFLVLVLLSVIVMTAQFHIALLESIIGGLVTGLTLWLVLDRESLYDVILGYGTYAWSPMIPVIFIFLPLSLWIFSNRNNVRASTNLLQVVGSEAIRHHPTDMGTNGSVDLTYDLKPDYMEKVSHRYDWTWRDALALTLRYQVPIIPSTTHSWWEASENPVRLLGLDTGINAQDYALLVTAYHWIAWPLFLIWIAGLVVRGRKS